MVLIAGDAGALLLEHKTVRDLVSSVRSNRLWSQLVRMLETRELLGYEIKRRLVVIHGGLLEYTNIAKVNDELRNDTASLLTSRIVSTSYEIST